MKYALLMISLASLFMACGSAKSVSTAQKLQNTSSKLDRKNKDRAEAYFFDANREKLIGNQEKSAQLFQKTLDLQPDNDAAMYELAKVKVVKGELLEGLKLMESASKLSPDNKWYQSFLGEVYVNTNQIQEAVDIYQNLIQKYPKEEQYYGSLAAAYIYGNKLKDAASVYQKMEEIFGFSSQLAMQRHALYVQAGEIDLAEKELLELIKKEKGNPLHYHSLARFYESQRREKDALETYDLILLIDPEDDLVHLGLSECYRKRGDDEKYYLHIEKALLGKRLDFESKISSVLNLYRYSSANRESRERSTKIIASLTETYPQKAKSFAMYGDFLKRDGKEVEAIQQYEKALAIEPNKPEIWTEILATDFSLSDFESMKKHAEKSIEFFPLQPGFYLYAGIAEDQLKNHQEAIAHFNSGKDLIIDNKPLQLQFHTSLADTYHKLGQHQESDKNFDEALKINPKSIYVLNNYSYYLSLRGENLDKAEDMSKFVNELEPNRGTYQDTYGWVLYKKGEYTKAEEILRQALKNGGGESGEVLEHYGDVLFQLEKISEAVQYWQKAKNKGGASSLIEQKITERKLYE